MKNSSANIVALAVGFIFAIGLGVSGMTQPQKVMGFLDVFRNWDPSLGFVMAGAIVLHASLYPLITKRNSPILKDQFQIPTRNDLTPSLFIGAGLFGIGWGLGGFCPGPAITSLASGNIDNFIFVNSMFGGMLIFWLVKPVINKFFN